MMDEIKRAISRKPLPEVRRQLHQVPPTTSPIPACQLEQIACALWFAWRHQSRKLPASIFVQAFLPHLATQYFFRNSL